MRHLKSFALVVSSLAVAALAVAASPPAKEAAAPAAQTPAAESSQCAPGTHAAPAMDHAAHGKTASKDREQVDGDGVVRRGSPLTTDLATTPVSAAVLKAKELDGKKVKLTGKVADVCTRMGCWFVVQGDKPEDKIRISTKAHDIFVPRSAVGMTATVEGTLSVKVLDAKTAQHFEDERVLKPGEKRRTITTDVNEIGIDVVGLEMKKAG